MADGNEDTWSPQSSVIALNGVGRQRSWNNTPGWSSMTKEQRKVVSQINGYDDTRYHWVQEPWDTHTVYIPSGVDSPSLNQKTTAGTIFALTGENLTGIKAEFDAEMALLMNRAKVDCLVKMADAKVNLRVALAEAHKTSDLIFDTARRIDRAYRAFRKGNLKGVAENLNITPKKLHKSWLEYKYGWMPLLMDVRGAAEFVAQQTITRKPRFSCSRTLSFVKKGTYLTNRGNPFGVAPSVSSTSDHVLSGVVKVKLWCELSSPHYSELQQLGITNPALVAWELVPFSFVFDWFIQVGDYLTALSAFHGVTILRAFESSIVWTDSTWTYPAVGRTAYPYSYSQTELELTMNRKWYHRVPWVPNPVDLWIPKKNLFDYTKLVTSLALLRGSYRGHGGL